MATAKVSRGTSPHRSTAARSAASRKGHVTRKRMAAVRAQMMAGEIEAPGQGSAIGLTMKPGDLIRQMIANIRAREEAAQ
ncbi:hypothetical protein U1769_24290 [Sphingomonas sp. ZT3P38]|uniref:hypothetical protein n=1 Tax=Parasphingomonas zepuensis TaxID=3096161 RepID=UPI002FC8BBD4